MSEVTLPRTLVAGTAENVNHVQENDEALRDGHNDLQTTVDDHIADTAGAHAASAISVTPAGTIAATTVQAALEEVASEAPGGFIQRPSKTIDQTLTPSNTTLQDVTGLGLTVGANEAWDVRVKLILSATSATPDFKFAFTVPAAGTFRWGAHSTGTGDDNLGVDSENAALTTGTREVHSINGTRLVVLEGIYTGGANAGTLQLQAAQNASHASDCKILIGSNVIGIKVSA